MKEQAYKWLDYSVQVPEQKRQSSKKKGHQYPVLSLDTSPHDEVDRGAALAFHIHCSVTTRV